jgi:hypothetical protein
MSLTPFLSRFTPLFFALCSAVAYADTSLPVIDVYKNRFCTCCDGWSDHLKKAGFTIKTHVVDDTDAKRKELGMPVAYASCHTAKIAGKKSYLLEGHVPVEDVKRLLKEAPDAIGIAVPAMPLGSPGMEVPKQYEQAFDTMLVLPDGTAKVFAKHKPK